MSKNKLDRKESVVSEVEQFEGDLGVEIKGLKDAKVGWFTRALLRLSLSWGMARLVKELGFPSSEACRKAHGAFHKTERIDVVPSKSGMRGFQIVLDSEVSLYFYQDGDHFVYDGYEMGIYGPGDVTIFDRFR